MDHTKIDTTDLDSRRQELSVRGLGFVVSLVARLGIDFSCAFSVYRAPNPAVLSCYKELQLDCPSVTHWVYSDIFSVNARF